MHWIAVLIVSNGEWSQEQKIIHLSAPVASSPPRSLPPSFSHLSVCVLYHRPALHCSPPAVQWGSAVSDDLYILFILDDKLSPTQKSTPTFPFIHSRRSSTAAAAAAVDVRNEEEMLRSTRTHKDADGLFGLVQSPLASFLSFYYRIWQKTNGIK